MEPLRIKSVELDNIGPFGQFVLDFPEKPREVQDKAEVHIFTGENGTGKTTLLEALVRSLPDGASLVLSKTRQNAASASLKVRFNYPLFQYAVDGNIKGFYVVHHPDNFAGLYQNDLYQQTGIAFFAYSGYRQVTQVNISSGLKEITTSPLNNALDFHKSVNPEDILQWIANNISKAAIASSKGDKIAAERFENAIHTLEKVTSTMIDKTVRFDLELEPFNVGVWVDNEKLNFNVLPDGLKSIISWMADLLMRMDRLQWIDNTPVFERNFILFLDEIEVHTHPAWQRKLLPTVQGLFPNAQIFVSTHSPFVVGSVDGAWIYKLIKPNGDSKLAEGYPMLSEDARSYRYWLEEVFGIKQQFGTSVEHELDEFYKIKDRIVRGENGATFNELVSKGRELARQSTEVNQIIEMEIRQLNRQKGLSINLWNTA